MSAETELRCPACGRWLGAVADYARLVCGACGGEVTFKSRAERRRQPTDLPVPRPRERAEPEATA